ncbi:hypothetical protein ECC01_22365 [Bacillus tequilensis]|nr:hypothetical protein [Bacillus tequilensis]
MEGPLYVAGAPVEHGFARLDDGTDENGHPLVMQGTVYDAEGKPAPGAQVEVWHCDTRGFYSHFDPTGKQAPFNMRRTIIADEQGRYGFRSIVPSGYGVPPGSPTEKLLTALGRHGQRPAHIHFSLYGRQFTERLVTQMYFPNDPLFFQDPIYNAVPKGARERMIAVFDYDETRENFALGYKFDIVLRGRNATPFE